MVTKEKKHEYYKKDYLKNKKKRLAKSKEYNDRVKPDRKEYDRKYRNRPEVKTHASDYRKNKTKLTKHQVFIHYSNGVIQCACCGELEIGFLTIDHINGRKQHNHKKTMLGVVLYQWIITNNYPDGFQVLCMNCNWAKGRLGICPHQRKKSLSIEQRVNT